MVDMIMQLIPVKAHISIGSQKIFASLFRPIKEKISKLPTCISMVFNDTTMTIQVQIKYEIDIIGETKLKIKVDDVVIDQMINTNYMNEK